MKKRKGWVLLECMLALFLISLAAMAAFPLSGHIARGLSRTAVKGQMTESAFFAGEFITEKIRNNGKQKADALPYTGGRYTYYEINTHGVMAPYRFYTEKDKLKIYLYNGSSQPVTGNTNDEKEKIIFEAGEDGMFHVKPRGLVQVSFRMKEANGTDTYDLKTAILPHADFYGLEDV